MSRSSRIIKNADQQARIFLQQYLTVASPVERARDLHARRGDDDAPRRFGHWAVQRCLEAAAGHEERRQIVACMRCVPLPHCPPLSCVDSAPQGPRGAPRAELLLLQKARDCAEEAVRLLIVSWAPPRRRYVAYAHACADDGAVVDAARAAHLRSVNKEPRGKWRRSRGTHRAVLAHGSAQHRAGVGTALTEDGKDALDRVVRRPGRAAYRTSLPNPLRAAQLMGISFHLMKADKLLHARIRSLRRCKTGATVIWLLDRVRAYYG
ncbi:hypothetical protein FB451DRAFT_1500554 [Mycena latifolia]|nr:hypothetical protein FB451DRAFT_1500554 [Mycena latifolia]